MYCSLKLDSRRLIFLIPKSFFALIKINIFFVQNRNCSHEDLLMHLYFSITSGSDRAQQTQTQGGAICLFFFFFSTTADNALLETTPHRLFYVALICRFCTVSVCINIHIHTRGALVQNVPAACVVYYLVPCLQIKALKNRCTC